MLHIVTMILFGLFVLYVGSVDCKLEFALPGSLSINLSAFHSCLRHFSQSQPVWSWVILHEPDGNQPFDFILQAIYKVNVPVYNYNDFEANKRGFTWFPVGPLRASTLARESKVFFLSKSKFHINLMGNGSGSFRTGDKILFTNYNRASRINFEKVINFFRMKTSTTGLTRYNLLPIVSFLFINETGEADPVTYIPIDRRDLRKIQKLHLNCSQIFSNSIDKLIFENDYFTVAAFPAANAIKSGKEFYGKDAIVAKILIGCTGFPYVYRAPSDGMTYGSVVGEYSGVYGAVARGEAQMALNSRAFRTEIITDNVVSIFWLN